LKVLVHIGLIVQYGKTTTGMMHLKNGIILILISLKFTLQETRRRTGMTLNFLYREKEQRTISVFCYIIPVPHSRVSRQ